MTEEVSTETVEETVKAPKGIPSGTMVLCDDGKERPVVTRKEAIEAESNRYFTGELCKNGHMAERKVKGYLCTTCGRNRQKERMKKRLASDPEYKKAQAEKRNAKHKERYANDPAYRQKVLDRGKARRAKAAEARAALKAQEGPDENTDFEPETETQEVVE